MKYIVVLLLVILALSISGCNDSYNPITSDDSIVGQNINGDNLTWGYVKENFDRFTIPHLIDWRFMGDNKPNRSYSTDNYTITKDHILIIYSELDHFSRKVEPRNVITSRWYYDGNKSIKELKRGSE